MRAQARSCSASALLALVIMLLAVVSIFPTGNFFTSLPLLDPPPDPTFMFHTSCLHEFYSFRGGHYGILLHNGLLSHLIQINIASFSEGVLLITFASIYLMNQRMSLLLSFLVVWRDDQSPPEKMCVIYQKPPGRTVSSILSGGLPFALFPPSSHT